MAIEFQCEHCNTTLRVPDEHAGKRAKCPKCQAVNLIQAGSLASNPFGQTDSQSPLAPSQSDFNQGTGAGALSKPAAANPYAASSTAVAGSGYHQAHRGSMILTLGIFALVCNMMLVPGIMAWVLGKTDLKEIDAGRMDPEGRGMTQAGMVLGIIGTLLPLVLFFLYIVFGVILMLFVGAAAAAG